jgi:isopentenyl diphosphate isomerase/L-lactate dehydrogenase-like FMN-dependent dehydrogenase
VNLARLYTVEDVHGLARSKLPRMVSDFIDGGAEQEITLARNRASFDALTLRPRFLAGVGQPDLSTTILGMAVRSPLMFAPTGLARLAHRDGELAVARVAAERGSINVVGVFGSYTLEEVRATAGPDAPLWFQLYLFRQRGVMRDLVQRALAADYQGLCLTVDTPVLGLRERDLRNNMKIPIQVTWQAALDVGRHPRWALELARSGPPTFASLRGVAGAEGDAGLSLIAYVNRELHDPAATWQDLEWLRSIWDRKLIVKGLLTADDAVVACELGADGIAVSNHGGRQLDGVQAAISAVPAIVEAVGDRAEVLVDGGIRRGSDVVKALALGARGCMIGRPYWWGLAAGGQQGVRRVAEIIDSETERVMALLGRRTIAELDSSVVGTT